MWDVELHTDAFLPYLPEEAQVNPGVYGFELAIGCRVSWLEPALRRAIRPARIGAGSSSTNPMAAPA